MLNGIEVNEAFGFLGWTELGKVSAAKGAHTLEIEGLPGQNGMALDCFALTRDAFKPAAQADPAQQQADH